MRTRIILSSVGAVIILLLLAGLTVVSAKTSMPNSPLYGLKLLREDLLEKITVDPADQLMQKFANIQTRFEEINYLFQISKAVPPKITQRLQEQIDQYLQLACQYEDTIQSAALMRLYEILLPAETIIGSHLNQTDPAAAPDLESLYAMIHDRRILIEFGLQKPAAFRSQILTGKWLVNEPNMTIANQSPEPAMSTQGMTEIPTSAPTPSPTPDFYPSDEVQETPMASVESSPTITDTPEPIPDEDDLPPGFEDITINPTPVEEEPDDDDENPPGIGDSPLYTATPEIGDDDNDDEPPPGIDGPVYTATPDSGENGENEPPEINP